MSSQEHVFNSELEELEGKYESLKKKHLKLRQKFKDFTGYSDEDISDDEENQHPVKKIRLDEEEKCMDPLVVLDEDCIDEVLKWLTPNELFASKLVSKSWKSYIESRTGIMKKAMENVVVKVTAENVKDMKPNDFLKALTADKKILHMDTDFVVIHQSYKFLFVNQAPTLKSLRIKSVGQMQYDQGPINFPRLQKLTLERDLNECPNQTVSQMIQMSSFPEVTHVKTYQIARTWKRVLESLMGKFPKLKVVHFDDPRSRSFYYDAPSETEVENKLKLEAICLVEHSRSVFDILDGSTLTEIYLQKIPINLIPTLLDSQKSLKSLGIGQLQDGYYLHNPQIPSHENLRTLKLGSPTNQTRQGLIFEFLRAFPSLSTLILGINVTKNVIEFVAREMISLQELICKRVPQTGSSAYRKVQRDTQNRFANQNFVLTIESDLKEVNEDFYNKHFIH